jgi:hypothetical protein
MKLWHLSLVAAALALTLAAPKAHAFTLDTSSGVNSDGSSKYVDPDTRFSGNGTTTQQFGNTTLQFGVHNGGLSNSNAGEDRERMFLQPNQPGSNFDNR